MAQIDVSDVLLDPDFIDPLKIINRTPVINLKGENRLVESCVDTFGSVQPASGKTLERLPDALRVPNVSSFWIKGRIIADGSCEYPDVIVFNEKRYNVQVVFDWTNWGAGWCEGTCVVERPSG